MATHSSTLKNKQKKRHMSCKEKKVMEKKKFKDPQMIVIQEQIQKLTQRTKLKVNRFCSAEEV